MVVELNPVSDCPASVLQDFEAMPVHALLLERADHALDHAVLLRAVLRDELLAQAITAHQGRVVAARKTRPLSLRSRNSWGTRPSVPNRAISACSNARDAVVARPLRDRCQSSNSRVWQSITSASVAQPSRLPKRGTCRSTSARSTVVTSQLPIEHWHQ